MAIATTVSDSRVVLFVLLLAHIWRLVSEDVATPKSWVKFHRLEKHNFSRVP